jgi:carbon-monoxide dehydrogenase medium subunit
VGARRLPAGDFVVGARARALAEDEIVTAVELPASAQAPGWGFEEVSRRTGDFALCAVGVTIRLRGGEVSEARIAVAGAGDTPLRLAGAEALLAGTRLEPDVVEAAGRAVRDLVSPFDDLHASADYRRHLAGVLAGRALAAAGDRARAPAEAPGR